MNQPNSSVIGNFSCHISISVGPSYGLWWDGRKMCIVFFQHQSFMKFECRVLSEAQKIWGKNPPKNTSKSQLFQHTFFTFHNLIKPFQLLHDRLQIIFHIHQFHSKIPNSPFQRKKDKHSDIEIGHWPQIASFGFAQCGNQVIPRLLLSWLVKFKVD